MNTQPNETQPQNPNFKPVIEVGPDYTVIDYRNQHDIQQEINAVQAHETSPAIIAIEGGADHQKLADQMAVLQGGPEINAMLQGLQENPEFIAALKQEEAKLASAQTPQAGKWEQLLQTKQAANLAQAPTGAAKG